MRLFVAVWPPAAILDRLLALERPGPEASAGVRWTGPEQWHVTLRFLGEVAEEEQPALVEALRAAVASGRFTPVTATVAERTARFGRRVLHVSVAGLTPWATAVEVATAEFGTSRPDGRAFVGHLTLARARDPRRTPGVLPMAGVALPPGPRSWTVDGFDLVRSRLGEGAGGRSTYQVVERFAVV